MEKACTNLTEIVRSVRLLKINGYSFTSQAQSEFCFKSRWNFEGYEWEICIHPRAHGSNSRYASHVAPRFVFLSEAGTGLVRTTLRCCLVDPRGLLKPSKEWCRTATFKKPQDSASVFIMGDRELEASGYLKDDSFIVQCTLEVLKELPDISEVHVPVPSSNLHQHFAELLRSEMGADVTFLVSGESIAAHKHILTVRSPVFKAAFLGDMKEKCSQSVEIKDMEAAVFKALLQFIYTDTVPEFRQQEGNADDTVPEFGQQEEGDAEAATVMAQHLLAAADRYGLDRLKLICAHELSGGINVETAATTLALAEQHNCPELKARCVQFITGTSATLDAVVQTEGYRHLEASCPLVVIDLFKAARGSKN